MTRVVFYTATSLNGFLADENGSLDWLFDVETAAEPYHVRFTESVGAIAQGSTTYAWVLEHGQADFCGARWPTFVFTSRRLPRPEGGDLRFVSGDVADVFEEMAQAAGDQDVWVVGGGDLAGQFLEAGLLDEIQLDVAPVALTGGASLLPRRVESSGLRLRGVAQHGQFAHLTYEVAGQRPRAAASPSRQVR